MKEGQHLDTFTTKNGAEIAIRVLGKADLAGVWGFYNRVITETPFLSRITRVSRKEEEKWFRETMKGMKKGNEIYIVAEHEGKIVGSVSITREEQQTHKHIGVYGICILQKYTGLGIGRKLSEHALKIAKSLGMEIVRLSVYDANKTAQGLYGKLGFRLAGIIPGGVKRKDIYMDDLIMYKVLK